VQLRTGEVNSNCSKETVSLLSAYTTPPGSSVKTFAPFGLHFSQAKSSRTTGNNGTSIGGSEQRARWARIIHEIGLPYLDSFFAGQGKGSRNGIESPNETIDFLGLPLPLNFRFFLRDNRSKCCASMILLDCGNGRAL
jgi:hypothetical protein